MSPALTLNNFINTATALFEMRNKLKNSHLTGIKKPSDFQNGFIGKVGTYFARHSFLVRAIGHVVIMCSGKQMRRIHACSIVALVENKMAVWYRAIVKQVRKSVWRVWLAVKMKVSMPVFALASSPKPALSEFWNVCRNWPVFINFSPKSGFGRNGGSVFISHEQKTPTKPEVKPEQLVGNGFGRCQSLSSLFFAAALRPQEVLHGI